MTANVVGKLQSNEPYFEPASNALNQLINSAIEHREEERKKLERLRNELREDQCKSLTANYSHLREQEGSITLMIKFDSPDDFFIWKFCLFIAVEKYKCRFGSIIAEKNVVRIELKESDFGNVSKYLHALAKRTNYDQGSLANILSQFCSSIEVSAVDPLQDMFDSVFEIHLNATNTFINFWEKQNNNERTRFLVDGFFISEGENLIEKINDPSALRIFCATECILWDLCLIFAHSKLSITESCICVNFKENLIQLSSRSVDLIRIIEILKPLLLSFRYNHVKLSSLDSSVMHLLSKLIGESNVDILNFVPVKHNLSFSYLLKLVHELKPSAVYYKRLGIAGEAENILIPLAGLVKIICVYEHERIHGEPISALLIKRLLSKKCKDLRFQSVNTVLSLSEVENLIQFLHHLSKKCRIQVPIESETFLTHVGEYLIMSYYHALAGMQMLGICNVHERSN